MKRRGVDMSHVTQRTWDQLCGLIYDEKVGLKIGRNMAKTTRLINAISEKQRIPITFIDSLREKTQDY